MPLPTSWRGQPGIKSLVGSGWASSEGFPSLALASLRKCFTLPRDPEFVFYDQLKQVMNAYRCAVPSQVLLQGLRGGGHLAG